MAKEIEKAKPSRTELIQAATTSIDGIVAECGVVALSRISNPLVQSVQLADGMRRMREVMNKSLVENFFMPLQGTPLGFVTDKDKNGGYSWEVVRDVVIEALLRGFRPIGNEFNIIADRFYGAKAGFERIVAEFPGLRDFDYELGVPHMVADKGALVSFEAHWTLNGEPMTLAGVPGTDANPIDTRIAVRVNAGMGQDAILGKATRKLHARVYRKLTGCSRDIVEMDPSDYVDAKAQGSSEVVSAPQGRRMSLKGNPDAEPTPAAHEQPDTDNERAAANPDDPDSYG